MVVLYDSLQLAHKCILNSFYGYVMRKGYGILVKIHVHVLVPCKCLIDRPLYIFWLMHIDVRCMHKFQFCFTDIEFVLCIE